MIRSLMHTVPTLRPQLLCTQGQELPRSHSCKAARCQRSRCSRASQESSGEALSTALDRQYEEQAHELLGLDPSALTATVRQSPISLGFMLWLADREAQAAGEALTALCQRLTAVREGLGQEGGRQQLQLVQPDEEESLLQLGVRWRALTKEAGAAALSPEAVRLAERQVSQLGAGVRQARAQSSLELIGRNAFAAGEGEAAMLCPADPAARILEALLAEAEEEQRFAMLPDAFAPPRVSAPTHGDEEELEQLFTTPARLVQAIDLALRHGAEQQQQRESNLLPSAAGSAYQFEDQIAALRALRAEVFRLWLFDREELC